MNSLQLLITGNKPFNLNENGQKHSESDSKVEYDLFLRILSLLEIKDIHYSKQVSRLWCKAATQVLEFECLLQEKLSVQSIINAITFSCDTVSQTMTTEDNEHINQFENRFEDIQNDLKLLALCKTQLKERDYENARILSNSVLTEKLKILILEQIDLAIWGESKEFADSGQIEEAFETASHIHDNEIRELAIQDIYDTEQEI